MQKKEDAYQSTLRHQTICFPALMAVINLGFNVKGKISRIKLFKQTKKRVVTLFFVYDLRVIAGRKI
jgi:hypothetical protein